MLFATEEELVQSFGQVVNTTRTSLPKMRLCFEFVFTGGKTDIIGVTGASTVHSFEAKLKRWRDCLQQAYRSTSFAHYSYVLLPEDVVHNALQEPDEFRKRGVGLCSFANGKVRLHIRPQKQSPLQPWLTKRAVQKAWGEDS